jgi:hypothetical protein
MTRDEQHRMVVSLLDHLSQMERNERSLFEMMAKRDRDDEDLDSISLHKLNQLYAKYIAKKSKEELEARWKKITGK